MTKVTEIARLGDSGLSALPTLGLYVHLPWCLKKCPYCDFNSHEKTPSKSEQSNYIDALIVDLESVLPQVWGRVVHTVFLGGGTPSLFDPDLIDQLLAAIRARLNLSPTAEVTMEANPGTFERARFEAFAQAGITRLSIGVQSFNDASLKALGRVHDRQQAIAAIETAAQCFDSYNIDLMFALPGQDLNGLRDELTMLAAFAPKHLSYYHLSLEPNTLFAKFPPAGLADDDLASDMLDLIAETADTLGLGRYEVSAYGAPLHECQHNLNYWRFGDYIGIGAGAHGKLSFHDRIVREQRHRHPRQYQQEILKNGRSIQQTRELAADDLVFEFMLNALRLVNGVPTELFNATTGLGVARISRQLSQAVDDGLLSHDPRLIRPTKRGLQFLNDLQMIFLPD